MRTIPATMSGQLAKTASTFTRLLKVMLKDGTSYGICMTNKDVTYDDGDGPLLYSATNGFDSSTLATDASYSVDNAEGYALISNDIPGITVEMVEAGALDDAQWACYLVNYEQPLAGSHVLLDAGDVGEVGTDHGLIWTPELLSYMMRLKQPVGSVTSKTCRATFGTPAASQTGCGVDASALWVDFTVTSVGAEDDRVFSDSSLPASGGFYPGRVLWVTGDNAGKLYATEEYDGTTGTVTLNETTPYAVKVGDTGRIRPDCAKTEDACKAYGNYLNMKAEPKMPSSDSAAMTVPGGQV